MKKKQIALIAVVISLSGLGLSLVGASPNPADLEKSPKTSQTLTIKANGPTNTEQATDVSNAPAAQTATDTPSPSTPQQSIQEETPTEEPAPAPITVASATKRIDVQGLHKDYYCDLAYTDNSVITIKIAQSDDTSWGKANIPYDCTKYVGQIK